MIQTPWLGPRRRNRSTDGATPSGECATRGEAEICAEASGKRAGRVDESAKHATKLNGFEHGVQTATVQVTADLAARRVEVIIDQDFSTAFLRAINWSQAKVRARALAGLEAYSEACVLALDRAQDDALKTNGNPTGATSCGIMSNSASGPRGLRATGAS